MYSANSPVALVIGRYNHAGVSTNASLSAIPFRPIPGVRGCECRPRLTEKQAHDSRAKFHVRFALSTVHVVFRKITDVMQAECGP
jgi:hypothetical protein